MRLIIAEKPEVAEAILQALGGKTQSRQKRSFQHKEDIITWCYGHLIELFDPEDYEDTDEGRRKAKIWSWETLPICIYPYRKKIIENGNSAQQYEAIANLLKKTDHVVHAGDPDDEGQLLVDEILEREKFKGKVSRVLINDLNPTLIQKAFNKLEPNSKYQPLGRAAEARSVSDMYYGYTMTRAFTLQARENGNKGVFNVGRVKTAIMGMVVRNSVDFEKHVKQKYFEIEASANCDPVKLKLKYRPVETDILTDDKKLSDEIDAKSIQEQIKKGPCKLIGAKTTLKKVSPPLPYSLINLQIDAANKFGYKSDDVLSITQQLREQHKLITYNRSDCTYLSDEQHADGLSVFRAILATNSDLSDLVKGADVKIKGKAFDSSKVTAHHAIIPTIGQANISDLSEEEKNVYTLIAQRYILQFYKDHSYEQTAYTFESNKRKLYASINVTKEQGWKAANNDKAQEDGAEEEASECASLPKIKQGDELKLEAVDLLTKFTKPKPIYTEAVLLKELTQAAKYCKDERLRKLLLEKDEDKEGERGGIGTPATRSTILKKMIDEDKLLIRDGKKIVASKSARALYESLPEFAIYPDLTALWFEDQKKVVDGKMTVKDFVFKQVERAAEEISTLRKEGMKVIVNMPSCPACKEGYLVALSGKFGPYWRCHKGTCNTVFKDENGKPNLESSKQNSARVSGGICPICKHENVFKINSKNGIIWICDNDQCKTFFEDVDNKPAVQLFDCPKCEEEKSLKLAKGKFGLYFKCQNEKCKASFSETGGEPDLKPKAKPNNPSNTYLCKTCGAGLIKYDKTKTPFWGCSNFKKTGCKTSYQCNKEGLPIYK